MEETRAESSRTNIRNTQGERYFVLLAIREMGDRPWPDEVKRIVKAASAEPDSSTRHLAQQLLDKRGL